MVEATPAPDLQPYIEQYVGYRVGGFPSGVHRGLPSGQLTFIVSVGDPIAVLAQTDPRQPPASYGFVLGGLQASAALIAGDRPQEGVAIGLTPVGCRAVLGLPARALWDMSLEADEVLGAAARELRERVSAAPTWAARFEACDHVLRRLCRQRGRAIGADVSAAWELVTQSGGAMAVGDIASEVGWGRRHLTARFQDEFGLSPKLASRVVRFDRARRMLQSPRRPALADVAHACGYYDQPHFNRDFLALAGCAPGEWMAAELPSVQDGGGPQRAQSAA